MAAALNPRRPQARHGLALAALAAVVAALGLAACGSEQPAEGNEGRLIHIDGVAYQVQISRTLNPGDETDRALLRGQPPEPAGKEYFGVFLIVSNDSGSPYTPPKSMEVVDTRGNRFERIPAPAAGQLELQFDEAIPPGEEAPPPDSLARTSSSGGALVLFLIDDQTLQNRPLELEVPSVRPGGRKKASVVLDI